MSHIQIKNTDKENDRLLQLFLSKAGPKLKCIINPNLKGKLFCKSIPPPQKNDNSP
jgi:hypothetical protein